MEYKKGDKLNIIRDFKGSGKGFKIGDILTVLAIKPTGTMAVQCSRKILGHDSGGLGKRPYCWNIYKEDLHHVEKAVGSVQSESKLIKRLNQSEFIGKLSSII